MKPAGTYSINLVGTLPDLVTKTSSTFTIVITNSPPLFTRDHPENVKIMVNTVLYIPLPPYSDLEG